MDDLLDLTRIVHGKLALHRQRVDLRGIAAHAVADFRVRMLEQGVTLDLAFGAGLPIVDADPARLTQVLTNLLQNAAKFTSTGDAVTVTVGSAGVVEVEVKDTGAGIDPSLLPNIFEPFVQGERTLGRSERGLGLGLALVKGIAALHGGSVHAESAGPGKGSTFSVRFPLATSIGPAIGFKVPVAIGVHPRSILVVDDDHDGADMLVELLRLLGHSVDVAYDGPSAIEKIRAAPPNVVLCDIGMPEMGGHELAFTLRAMAPDEMRIIAVTGYAQPDDVKRALAAGFDALVAKPADIAEIERLLH